MFLLVMLEGELNSFLLSQGKKGTVLAFTLKMITLEFPFLLKGSSRGLPSSIGLKQLEVEQGKHFSLLKFTRDLSCT